LIDRVLHAPVPVVILGTVQGGAPVDFYGTDTTMATQIATEHLLAQGSTRVGYIGGPLDTRPGRERLAGYETAMSMDSDAPLGESIEISQSFQFEDALVAARALIERYRPDGLVCVNDRVAMAAMRVLDELNLPVPGAVRVVSIDNSELSTMSHPGISSVDLFADKRGTLAANRLRAHLAGTVVAGEVEQVVLKPSLVVRGSSA
jgi:LacI family transcriptional regulator